MKTQCGCTSDQGPICKHVAALILYLKQSNFNLIHQSESSRKIEERKKFYQEQIKSIVNSSTDRDGYIGWYEMSNFEDAIYPIIFNADKQYADKNYKIAFYIATALMEKMIEVMQFSDDSTNVIGGIIDDSFAMLHNIVTADLPKGFKNEVLTYCVKAFQEELFEGWGWHLDILRIAYRLIEDEAEADIIIECLEKVAIEDYMKEQTESFKLQILSEYKDK